jgi:hypothetical protein
LCRLSKKLYKIWWPALTTAAQHGLAIGTEHEREYPSTPYDLVRVVVFGVALLMRLHRFDSHAVLEAVDLHRIIPILCSDYSAGFLNVSGWHKLHTAVLTWPFGLPVKM